MNFKAIAMATILGLSTPAVIDIATNNPAVATTQFNYPSGYFTNSALEIGLAFSDNAYQYSGTNLKNNSRIFLAGATVSGTKQRQVYTWRNNLYRYQISWQPTKPHVVRLQVFSNKGKMVVNTLLYQNQGG